MTNANAPDPTETEKPLVSHLVELRDRVLRMVLAVAVVFLGLFPFSNEIYVIVAEPLMAHMPAGTSMIATEVASPFLTPFKLSLVGAIFVAMPYILFQLWAFIAPGLYRHEKRLVFPLVISSILLFYLGMMFAYFVVFPLVFAFLTGTAPEGVAVMTDIARYLDFVLKLFFAFGIAFEVPIATIILVWMGITTPEKLRHKRPYIIVGAFVFGMLLTPPDVISQTLLAVPMWILFELGLVFAKIFVRKPDEAEPAAAGVAGAAGAGPGGRVDPDELPAAAREQARGASGQAGGQPTGVDVDATAPDDRERFVPMSDAEMEAELDAIEAEEARAAPAGSAQETDPLAQKLRRVQTHRDAGEQREARELLYEILASGDEDARLVARNILAQLDED